MNKKKITFLTGSGISQPSGLNTFRTQNGFWNNHKVEDIASVEGFYRDPLKVNSFYNQLRKEINQAQPNIAHETLANLQQDYDITIITQNVDNLHERAGSNNVMHLHGVHDHMRCLKCKYRFYHNADWYQNHDTCPTCGEISLIKPDIVFFGEMLDPVLFYQAEDAIREADLFVQIGTSAEVQPANKLIKRAKRRKRVEMNLVRSNPKRPFLFHNYYIGNITKSIAYFEKDIPLLMELNETGIFKKF